MFGKKHFLRLGGAIIIGMIALAITAIIFFLLLPHILTVTMAILIILLIFITIWVIIYLSMVLGAAVHHFILPFHYKKRKV